MRVGVFWDQPRRILQHGLRLNMDSSVGHGKPDDLVRRLLQWFCHDRALPGRGPDLGVNQVSRVANHTHLGRN